MSASRNRIFINTGMRREKAGDKITVTAACCDNKAEAVIIKSCFGIYLFTSHKDVMIKISFDQSWLF
jgi:hypothetical protein